ncbi:ATPase AAA [Spirochaetia bacterium]|nr:ATPase AAA [Spirochaetia bacterium]
MSSEKILAELDNEQRQAASVSVNAVVAAGAGSGKTKVLAARYAWLVMDRKIPVDQILTLTFTNKAVSEMYSRIYDLLSSEQTNAEARQAIANFHEARISTLDSFSALIARQAARRYGITPEFKINDAAVRELALSLSLPFVLEHRDNPELQMLLADKKIRRVAEELFAGTVLAYSPITRPLDLSGFMKKQQDELVKQWNIKTAAAEKLIETIKNEMEAVTKKTGVLYTALQTIINKKHPAIPGIENIFNGDNARRKDFSVYFEFLAELKSVSLVGGNAAEFSLIKDSIKELREPLYGELESIANMALQNNITKAVFPLVEEFQNQFNRKKREAGILTFNDIACLAVDALSDHPDIRQVYKDSSRAIMVDEFQDNNSLQRDLIFLLAEKPERQAQGIPRPEELTHDKMFFVGDEKQSIYRFRGADVSVFRRLAKDLSGSGAPAGKSLSLVHNYRSNPRLIEAFNRIFGGTPPDIPGVFLNDDSERADFEAGYIRLNPPASIENENEKTAEPLLTFCFLDEGALNKNDSEGLDHTELEAAFIAAKIRKLVDEEFKIQVRENGETVSRPCAYGDFAVLQRSYSHQNFLEKQLKIFGIPFNADRPAGLFNDAPVNDLYHLLRLLAYPLDRFSYAAVIRSPFFRLSDETLTICLLDTTAPPFDEALEGNIPVEEREKFQAARRHFNGLSSEVSTLSVTELLTKLWFDEGYRYETIWTASAQIYSGLFDLFFEIARKSDESGKGLPDFIDHVSALISLDERADDLDIPSEDETGVRLMSIHKSKGLEFPVVFVYNCGGKGANLTNTESVFFSNEWGLSLNLPQADELSGNSGNYFFKTGKEQEKARSEAELRRLLYVAMTRAESALFVTASLPEQNKDEKEEYDPSEAETPEDFITNRIVQLSLKAKNGINSFLDLLVPVIASCEDPPFYIEAIPVLPGTELRRLAGKSREKSAGKAETMFMAAEKAAPFYATTDTVFLSSPEIRQSRAPVNASKLKIETPENSVDEDLPPDDDKSSNLDRLLKLCKLEAADFGTIAHSFIEDHFVGRIPLIPPKFLAKINEVHWAAVNAEAKNMAAKFFESDLGKISMNAVYRETEFPIITMVNYNNGKIPVRGQLDLVFESNGIMYVVDFKTDRRENPAEHSGQLAVYARAVSDIFGKPVQSWLFYLRSGHEVEMTAMVEQVNIEKMVDNAISV